MQLSAHTTSNQVSQLQYESSAWKRLLEFIITENSFCKNRLGEMIRDTSGSPDLLDQAEWYQNSFIQQEMLVKLIRNDIAMFDKLLSSVYREAEVFADILTKRKKLVGELEKLEEEFRNAKGRFNHFLQDNSLL